MKMNDCTFCKIIEGEIQAKFEYKDDEVVAFWDIKPVAPVHILIIPKKHIESLGKVADEDKNVLGKIQVVAKKIAKKLELSSFRLATASGYEAGQRVFHIHYHLVGGWKKESDKITMNDTMKPQE